MCKYQPCDELVVQDVPWLRPWTGSSLVLSVSFTCAYSCSPVKRRLVPTLGPGPFPGLLDMWGGGGGLVEYRASLLASHGYATLALGYLAPGELYSSGVEFAYFEVCAEFEVFDFLFLRLLNSQCLQKHDCFSGAASNQTGTLEQIRPEVFVLHSPWQPLGVCLVFVQPRLLC